VSDPYPGKIERPRRPNPGIVIKKVMSLRLKHYRQFEAGVEESAMNQAEKLIADFDAYLESYEDDNKSPAVRIIYTTEQSKCVEEYTLLKVWHILKSSGFFLDYKVFKLKDRCRVVLNIELCEIESDDESDSDDEPQEDPIITS